MQETESTIPEPEPNPSGGVSTGTMMVAGFVLFALTVFAFLSWWSLYAAKPDMLKKQGSSRLPVMGTVPAFELEERGGERVGLDSLKGRVWIADFIFTRCSGPCIVMSQNMKALQDAVGEDSELSKAIRFVSITADPEWDTPEVLKRYADSHKADAERWMFLTGDHKKIQSLAQEGFKLAATGGEAGEPVIHAQTFALVDGKARIRGYYDGTNGSEVKSLLADARKLAAEEAGK